MMSVELHVNGSLRTDGRADEANRYFRLVNNMVGGAEHQRPSELEPEGASELARFMS